MEINAIVLGMIQDAAELAATSVLTRTGAITPYVSKSQAIKIVGGEATLNRFISEGLIDVRKDGPRNSKVRISRVQLEAVLKVSNRPSYRGLK